MNSLLRLAFIISLYSFIQVAIANPVVSLTPDIKTVNVGDEFSVDVVVSDLPVTEGGGFNLTFDPSMVQVTSVSVDNSVWTFKTLPGVIDNETGKVSDVMFARFDGISGDINIATVQFEGVGSGEFLLTLEESKPSPFASNGKKLTVQFKTATVNVTGIATPDVAASTSSGSLNLIFISLFLLLSIFCRIRF